MKTNRFFTYSQNNSGGAYLTDEKNGVGEFIIIEAFDQEEARNLFSKIARKVDGMHDSSPCCGDRWYGCQDDEGTEMPTIGNYTPWCDKTAYVHRKDKPIKAVYLKKP